MPSVPPSRRWPSAPASPRPPPSRPPTLPRPKIRTLAMTAHLIADPTPPLTTPDPATTAPGWLTLSAALTDEVPVIADREDLLVTVAPGAGHGAPACFLPAHA